VTLLQNKPSQLSLAGEVLQMYNMQTKSVSGFKYCEVKRKA